jgi:hypothetical protein
LIAPKLLIRKRMLMIQNRVRPCCFVQAVVNPAIQSVLEQHFLGEALFRRVSYSSNWPEAAVKVPPSLGPALSALLKNDACPEISVKTILAGQMHQAANVWEMMSFELIAKVAFNNLVQLIATVVELDRDIYYTGQAPASLEPDTPATTPGSEIATADASTLAA